MKKFSYYYKLAWKKWLNFSGRSTREEYWYATGMSVIWYLVLSFVSFIFTMISLSSAMSADYSSAETALFSGLIVSILILGVYLIISIPFIALTYRRFRDVGIDGQLLPLGFILIENQNLMLSTSP